MMFIQRFFVAAFIERILSFVEKLDLTWNSILLSNMVSKVFFSQNGTA